MSKGKNNEGDHFLEVEPPTAKLPDDVFAAVTRRDLPKIVEEKKPLSLDLSELDKTFEQSVPTVRVEAELSTRDRVIAAIKACENPDKILVQDQEVAPVEEQQPAIAQSAPIHPTLPPPTMDSEGVKRTKRGGKAKK